MIARYLLRAECTRMMAVMVAVALALWVSPAVAGKVALTDSDLDEVSAGGSPTIIETGDGSPVDWNDDSQFNLNFDVPEAQIGFRALAIQNVVGELQLLVNLNVLSANGNVNSTDQRNFSLQSWGGTLPIPGTGLVATVSGVAAAPCPVAGSCNSSGGAGGAGPAAVTGGNGDSAASSASAAGGNATGGNGQAPTTVTLNAGHSNPACTGDCTGDGGSVGNVNATRGGAAIAGNAAAAAAAAAGDGGNASGSGGNGGSGGNLTVSGNASSSPGVVAISPTASASGDLIIRTGNGSEVTAVDNSQYNLTFTETHAQSDLAALFISNVVGRSQMALNLNIASSQFTTVPFAANAITGDVTGTIKQVNTGLQFRGTPLVGSTGSTANTNLNINHQNQ